MASNDVKFSLLDYVFFGLTLCISTGIGIFYAVRSWRNKSGVDEYLTGSRRMPLLPTAMSLLASFVSGISIISYPAEVYTNGLVFFWFPISAALAVLISGLFILPILYRLRNSFSIFAYFEYRFGSRLLRSYVSFLAQLTSVMYVSVVLYTPSIALANLTGIHVHILIVTVGLVCTVYTAIGGLKAVVWTDFFQVFIMYAGLLALAIKGTMAAGGLGMVFQTASKHDRIQGILNIDPDPFQYMTLWTAVFGGVFYWLGSFGPNQITLQRYCSLPTIRQARTTIFLNVPSMLVMMALVIYIGLTMVAKYADCDPRLTDMALKKDQLLLSFMMDTLDDVHGLPGLFVACIFSATLSSVSSGINSLCALFLEDILKPLTSKRPLNERTTTMVTKCIGAFYGVLAIGLAFAAGPLGGIFKATMAGLGTFTGPTVGLFLLGMIFPCANHIGAFAGSLTGLAVVLWIFIGSTIKNVAYSQLPSDISGCATRNFTYDTTPLVGTYVTTPPVNVTIPPDSPVNPSRFYTPTLQGVEQMYALPSITYPCIGAIVTVLAGLVISLVTRSKGKRTDRQLTCWAKNDDQYVQSDQSNRLMETQFQEEQ